MKGRVLIVNKFYYRRGGDCVYALNLESMLASRGHEVAVFSMHSDCNLPSVWSKYFAANVSFDGTFAEKIRGLWRMLGLDDVAARFRSILYDFRPDVVHLNNIHSYLSPVIAREAHKFGAKVVWTMHDYKLICPSYTCMRDGRECTECSTSSSLGVVRHRCLKQSLAASFLGWIEHCRWPAAKMQRWVDAFVCPGEYMKRKMLEAGFDESKLKVLNNFVDVPPCDGGADEGEYYCYVGRLSEEKGIVTLLEASRALPYLLKVAGMGAQADELKRKYGSDGRVCFLGNVDSREVFGLLRGARLSVMPSECNENNPLSVIESLMCGTPVVVSDRGGLPELVDDSSGAIFKSGDVNALCKAIDASWNREWDAESISTNAVKRFSSQGYYDSLMQLYAI